MTSVRFDADELARLEEERDFLLRSLDDLESEREAGNLEPDEYAHLKDDYTARAAAVIRAIRDGLDARPQRPPRPPRRTVVAIAAVVAFAVLAAALLARSLGERLPGQTVTGNAQLATGSAGGGLPNEPVSVDDLAKEVRKHPRDASTRIAYGAALLDQGKAAAALRQYDEAARLAPTDAEPRAYGAWIVFLAGLPDEALRRLDQAELVNGRYADTFFFRGLVLLRGTGDRATARANLEHYLQLAPRGPFAEDARVAIKEIDKQADAPATSNPTRPNPTSPNPVNTDKES